MATTGKNSDTRKLSLPKCIGLKNRWQPHSRNLPVTDLSLNKPWGPIGGHRQSKDRCNEPRRPPLPHSPLVEEEEEGRAPQTHQCLLGEAEEAERGCLLLNEDRRRIRKDDGK